MVWVELCAEINSVLNDVDDEFLTIYRNLTVDEFKKKLWQVKSSQEHVKSQVQL